METKERKKLGKKTRAEGKVFEPRVYKDLTEKGWIVNRWSNDVKENKLVQAKTSWRRTPHGMFPMNLTPGFPDFMAMKNNKFHAVVNSDDPAKISKFKNEFDRIIKEYPDKPIICGGDVKLVPEKEVIGVECKISGKLDKIEKEKCQYYLDNNIFSKILIAYKTKEKNRIKVNYKEFKNEEE